MKTKSVKGTVEAVKKTEKKQAATKESGKAS